MCVPFVKGIIERSDSGSTVGVFVACTNFRKLHKDFSVQINGETVDTEPKKGYIEVKRVWKKGDFIDLSLPMPIEMIQSHPFVEENRGKVAIKRGPVVYCAEAADNNFEVRALKLDHEKPDFHTEYGNITGLGKIVSISGNGFVCDMDGWKGKLYVPTKKSKTDKPIKFRLIPYYSWANRTAGPMVVWIKV